jgi:hypothetical protein
MAELDELLEGNTTKPFREQLTLIRIFEELRGRGYDGGYDAVRRYARRWVWRGLAILFPKECPQRARETTPIFRTVGCGVATLLPKTGAAGLGAPS